MTRRTPFRFACVLFAAVSVLVVRPEVPAEAEHVRTGRVVACFAPGTPDSYMRKVAARAAKIQGPLAFQASDFFRWSSTAVDGSGLRQGDPTTLTWSVVPDGTSIPTGVGEPTGPSDLRAFLDRIYGNESNWLPLFERVFARWGDLTGITYIRETTDDGSTLGVRSGQRGVRADVRIGGHLIDGSFGVLAYNSFPNDGDMVIDTSDTFFNSTGGNSRALRNVLAHEHGHGLALDHVCPRTRTKLMEPSLSLGFDGPQHDDVLGAQRLYGDRLEPNDTSQSATDLGTRGATKFTVRTVSIDDDSDTDWYAVTVAAGASADVTLRPFGKTYDQGPEAQNGCGPTARVDTRALVDLRLSLFTPAGALIATANVTGPGGNETLLDVPLPAGTGTYLVRVRGSGENDVQMYELDLKFVQRGAKPVALDDADETWEVLPVTTDVLGNDEGIEDEPITVRVTTPPVSGKVKKLGRSLVYIPDAGFSGDDEYTYEVSDVHTQASTAVVSVTVRPSEFAGSARIDTDGDNYPDDMETAAGTSPTDPAVFPGADLRGVQPQPLSVKKLVLKLKSRRPLKDSVKLIGALPVNGGFDPAGERVVVYVGGIVREFVLDAKGRAALPPGDTFALRLIRRRGEVQPALTRFDLKIAKAQLTEFLADEGIDTSRRQKKEPRAVTILVLFDGRTFRATVSLTVSARAGRTVKAKLAR